MWLVKLLPQYTSRKLCSKKIAAKSGWGSFDQLDLQSLNDNIFVFWFIKLIFENLGTCNILLGRSWKYLSKNILYVPEMQNISIA